LLLSDGISVLRVAVPVPVLTRAKMFPREPPEKTRSPAPVRVRTLVHGGHRAGDW
jgi:hypothetical protein